MSNFIFLLSITYFTLFGLSRRSEDPWVEENIFHRGLDLNDNSSCKMFLSALTLYTKRPWSYWKPSCIYIVQIFRKMKLCTFGLWQQWGNWDVRLSKENKLCCPGLGSEAVKAGPGSKGYQNLIESCWYKQTHPTLQISPLEMKDLQPPLPQIPPDLDRLRIRMDDDACPDLDFTRSGA